MDKELVLKKVKNTFILERIDLTYKLDNMEVVLLSFLDTGDCRGFV